MPDTLVGTDSHTTMINALGVLGWGVGGIEAEAVMLGQPIYMTSPQVVGVRLSGALASGVTATDLVLTMTERLRQHGVVGKFIEFFGPGLGALTVADRATISNMSPEFGATAVDVPRRRADAAVSARHRPLGRPRRPGRALHQRAGALPHRRRARAGATPRRSTSTCPAVEPSLAGPRRPQDRVPLPRVASQLRRRLRRTAETAAVWATGRWSSRRSPRARTPRTPR